MKPEHIEPRRTYEGRNGERRYVKRIYDGMSSFWVAWLTNPDDYLEKSKLMKLEDFAKWAKSLVT